MNPDSEIDGTSIQSLLALWQDEEKRLRLILEDPQTSPSILKQVGERLASVLDQAQCLADERDGLKQTS